MLTYKVLRSASINPMGASSEPL